MDVIPHNSVQFPDARQHQFDFGLMFVNRNCVNQHAVFILLGFIISCRVRFTVGQFTHQTVKHLFAVAEHVREAADQRHFEPAVRKAHGQLLDPVNHVDHTVLGTRTVQMSESNGSGAYKQYTT